MEIQIHTQIQMQIHMRAHLQLLEDNTGSLLLPAKYDVANIHF